MDRRAFVIAFGAGAAAQLLLVILGHFMPFVADNVFALGGATISLCAGVGYAQLSKSGARRVLGGAAAGTAGAVLGIAVSVLLGDVPPVILLFGAIAAALGGGAGAALSDAVHTRKA